MVPMVALPLGRDQFVSSRHIAHHGRGFVGDVESITASELVDLGDNSLAAATMRGHSHSTNGCRIVITLDSHHTVLLTSVAVVESWRLGLLFECRWSILTWCP
jgi:hypothetical protein